MKDVLHKAHEAMESSVGSDYAARHGIASQATLTITDDETARLVAESVASRIAGRTVVEIGGGTGLLVVRLGHWAKRVSCIEANPMWASAFIALLYATKPRNVSYLFGAAEEFAGSIRGDVAVFCTHSGVESMRAAASLFAPEVIDLYGEIVAADPSRFEPLARATRPFA